MNKKTRTQAGYMTEWDGDLWMVSGIRPKHLWFARLAQNSDVSCLLGEHVVQLIRSKTSTTDSAVAPLTAWIDIFVFTLRFIQCALCLIFDLTTVTTNPTILVRYHVECDWAVRNPPTSSQRFVCWDYLRFSLCRSYDVLHYVNCWLTEGVQEADASGTHSIYPAF